MKIQHLLPLLLLALLLVSPAIAGHVSDDPGYLDLEWITIPNHAAEIQDIDLSDILLTLAADSKNEGNESLAEALSMIHSIRVKGFSLTQDDVEQGEKSVDKAMERLEKERWDRLIYVKNDDETLTVSTKSDKGKMVGLMLVVFNPNEEALFINVAGDLNLGTLLKLAQNFDSDDLSVLLNDLPQNKGDDQKAE